MLSPWLPSIAAGALLCWPPRRPDARLAALSEPAAATTWAPRWRRLSRGAVFGAVPLAALLTTGLAGGVAAALLAAACWRQWRDRRAATENILAAQGIASALGAMVAELRAGAHPVVAAESAAVDAAPAAAATMRKVAASARLNGELGDGRGSGTFDQLSRAWSLVRHHGLPMAEVLDAVRRDVVAGVRFASQARAKMAGPRASAVVLALLPAVGVGLGEAMGAGPVHVLLSTTPGQIMLVLGCGLIWAGMAWSTKLTEQVVPG